MTFVDEATVSVRAGTGGDGCVSFHREPYKPKGGPDGGNGGRGGSVILEVSSRVRDLSELVARPHRGAEAGKPGSGNNRTGAEGEDTIIPVPDGTVVADERGFVADLVGDGARVVVALGGRGGRGNAAIAGPKNKAPRTAEPGEAGEERKLSLELRMIADVGLVGLPNAGKSTLLSRLTAARPKVAAYAFTTLTPNLGVAESERRFIVADVPGLVEGAHAGKGLGDRFLRHLSRCPVLACVVDSSSVDPAGDVRTVREELAAYDAGLGRRPMLIIATKADLLDDTARERTVSALESEGEVLAVSGLTGGGIGELAKRLSAIVAEAPPPAPAIPSVVLRPGREDFNVTKEGGRFRVAGRRVEQWVARTDFDDPSAIAGLQRRIVKEGVERALAAAGARRGDDVVIGDREFEFIPEEE